MKIFFRVVIYLLGMFSLALGVAVSVNSGLGVSPVNSFPIAISTVTGFPKGTCVTVVLVIYVLIQIAILRKDFKIKNLLQVVFATIFGYFVDLCLLLIGDFAIPTYFGKLAMLAMSIVLIGLGLALYLAVDIVPMPSEGLSLAITEKLKKYPFHRIKIIFDCTSVTLAIIVSFVGLGTITGVREGTVLTALLAGKVMAVISKFLKPRIDALCFEPAKEPALAEEAEQP